MDRTKSLAAGALIAAALWFRQAVPPQSEPAGTPQEDRDKQTAAAAPSAKEGPWIASCKYWAPVRQPLHQPEQPSEIQGTMGQNGRIDLHLHLNENRKTEDVGCGVDPNTKWGLPAKLDGVSVTAMIATIPDPVHTHLALAFDRTIDSMLQAAADNGYVSSYYWLPWKHRHGELRSAEVESGEEEGHEPEREKLPGLVILKYLPQGDMAHDSRPFLKVVYLFLVAETPTEGVDGFQLQNAIKYENDLRQLLSDQHFSRGGNGHISIIGPLYSGSWESLHAGLEYARTNYTWTGPFHVAAVTSTMPFADTPEMEYKSFGEDRQFAMQTLFKLSKESGYDLRRFAVLSEDDTAFGNVESFEIGKYDVQSIRFPREISLLRNAQVTVATADDRGSIPSPYLRFSLKDNSAHDSVPQFSREHTPLSQEAEMMAIARELRRFRIQFAIILASNALDQIFLAQSLHRACPDTKLVFLLSDLLFEREIDNVPFIGSIALTPYPLIGLRTAGRAYPTSTSEAVFNAVSYSFCDGLLNETCQQKSDAKSRRPILQGYRNLANPAVKRPALWATTIGSDGYYPLGIVSIELGAARTCDNPRFLPSLDAASKSNPVIIYPSRAWDVLCLAVCAFCILHCVMLLMADFWSPFTRDLAIGSNDQPRRRSAFIHVATAMLFSMSFAVTTPILRLARVFPVSPVSELGSIATLLAGVCGIVLTFWKTRHYIGWVKPALSKRSKSSWHIREFFDRNAYLWFNLMTWTALAGVAFIWAAVCWESSSRTAFVGLSFCYRSLNPGSGVSPLVPVILLLFGWYAWAVLQTRRLRFSENGRPWMPGETEQPEDNRFFVSDEELARCEIPRDSCLYRNIICLLITRQALCRLGRFKRRTCLVIDCFLIAAGAGLLVWFGVFTPISSLDHFLWATGPGRSDLYERLVGLLLFPLLAAGICGWLRMIFIWGALKRGLLERLENLPIRFAFTRLKAMGWMTMLRRGALQEQWRDMARGVESMRQILNEPDLKRSVSEADHETLQGANSDLLETIRQVRGQFASASGAAAVKRDYEYMREIEWRFAIFAKELLCSLLIPYWKNLRTGLVESSDRSVGRGEAADPPWILAAEEFLAIRYISLIRAVLTNLRYLMFFGSISFVLAILAWNSYPFQPRQYGDWLFTALLAILGCGVVYVLAQMHRNRILSRITDTGANELGWDFYLRVISFGVFPVLTWVAYQFPDVGSVIYRIIQPVVSPIK